MSFEPEAISEEEQRVVSIRARTEWAEERREENRRRDDEAWITRQRKVEMRARSLGVDLVREQTAIRRLVLTMEQRLSGRGTFLGGTFASA